MTNSQVDPFPAHVPQVSQPASPRSFPRVVKLLAPAPITYRFAPPAQLSRAGFSHGAEVVYFEANSFFFFVPSCLCVNHCAIPFSSWNVRAKDCRFCGLSAAVSRSPLASTTKRIISVSVRELVAFVLRTGDLGGTALFAGPNRALEGTRGHQRLQKSRPAAYIAEVAVKHEIERPEFVFRLKGRIDGVLVENGSLLIEEIKTVSRLARGEADPLHMAQAKIYAFLYAQEHGFDQAELRVTYLELDSLETAEFTERISLDALRAFFDSVLGEYLEWLIAHGQWIQARDESAHPPNDPGSCSERTEFIPGTN